MSEQDDVIMLPYGNFIDEYDLMENFAYSLPKPYQDKILDAIQGKGAFRRFRETVRRLELEDYWYRHRKICLRREIRKWCDVMGVNWTRTYMN